MTDEPIGTEGGARKKTPPYISFKTFVTLVQDQQEHGVPTHIDRSVLTRFSGSVGGQLLAALKFLGLIDTDQSVSAELHTLVAAHGTENWKPELAALIKRCYSPLFTEDLERITPAKFHELFKNHYDGKDTVLRKCEVFFLKAAEAADIPVNSRIIKHRAPPRNGASKKTPKPPKPRTDNGDNYEQPDRSGGIQKSPYEMLIEILDPNAMEDDEQNAVWTLIRYLRRQEADQ